MMDIRVVTYDGLPDGDIETAWINTEFQKAGFRTEIAVWSDPEVDWSTSAVTLIRCAWDYHQRRDEFLDWAEATAAVSLLQNPLELIRWNSHKSYLLDLATEGVPSIPAKILTCPTTQEVIAAAARLGWADVVVKPVVGADGEGVERLSVSSPPSGNRKYEGDWLLQPYVTSVASDGEFSVVFLEGEVVNVIRKRPALGDFRVQERFGGGADVAELSPEWIRVAEKCVSLSPEAVYARVDLVEFEGSPVVMELELVEPSLFLDMNPKGMGQLVTSMRRLLQT